MGATGKSTGSPLASPLEVHWQVHWKSTGSPLEVHWPLILGVFDDLADCEADGGWVAGEI
ncbi:hypothetical protein E4U49_006597 [Claviceps purpurea]|nr:hypothetical protein E4U49_006597 [Claviceps purpurea]